MLFPDLPPPGPTSPVTVACVQQAAVTYGIPEALILAVLETEGGRPGLARRNRDGSHDLGPMQVNTRWVRREGLNARDLRDHGCYNLHVGAAILARELR
ncbi:MAG: lytic transglycosylase domain-containing protein, partial [Candidatus Contendobacter sp.]|nr:lytic transglycosylase domain-containing protein [Candidatus Contendobacter sp.]